MREIKFRGFYNFKGNVLYPPKQLWIYGYYYFQDGKHWIKDSSDIGKSYMVEDGSVGEYTGLKDKNGTEIYEGDLLVRDIKPIPMRILWNYSGWAFTRADGKDLFIHDIEPGLIECLTVIGNIYENRELLEVKE